MKHAAKLTRHYFVMVSDILNKRGLRDSASQWDCGVRREYPDTNILFEQQFHEMTDQKHLFWSPVHVPRRESSRETFMGGVWQRRMGSAGSMRLLTFRPFLFLIFFSAPIREATGGCFTVLLCSLRWFLFTPITHCKSPCLFWIVVWGWFWVG
ncbi:hypothetical protein F5Y08DRAFT_168883 [Xylaria arbuscula]|nr:hypothetical protein F5Y08DRAFT_168883 [Xylaria arbuscula]